MRAVFRNGTHLAWWFGQGLCGLCCLAAVVVLVETDFNKSGQTCAVALGLLGFLALIGGNWLRRLGARRTRRRRSRTTAAGGRDSIEVY